MDKKFYDELIEAINYSLMLLDTYKKDGFHKGVNATQLFDSIRSIGLACMDGDKINIYVKQDIPLKKQAEFSREIYNIARFSVLGGGVDGTFQISNSLNKVQQIIEEINSNKLNKSIKPQKVFYSWQSFLPNKTNRNLIKDSLEKALKEINKELSVDERIELDSDTKNTVGSPDIVHTIMNKIDNSDIFIADVSIIKGTTPNPNVMLELGYALKTLGDKKIIMLFNDAFGNTKDLPFDLGFKRQMIYSCTENDNIPEVRIKLISNLKNALTAILRDDSNE
jgi:nucleoside 2-deoxyribosyltransferase